MKQTRLEILDEVNVHFHDLDAVTRRKIVEAMRFFVPHAKHTPAYKLGRWDGYVSYATLGGVTQLNYLDRILPIVIDAGYEIDLDDKRVIYDFQFDTIHEQYFADLGKVWPKGHPAEGKPVELRDYQVEIINNYLESRQALQEISTSAGKTLITAALSSMVEKYGRTLVIVPSKSLVVQTAADYRNLGLDVGVYYGETKEVGHTHTISTWQSLESLFKAGKGKSPEDQPLNVMTEGLVCVMVDEAHGAKGDVLRSLLCGPFGHIPLRFGLTGTIPKEEYNFMAMLGSIGPVIHRLAAKTLQDQGVLSQCQINIVQTEELGDYKTYPAEHKYLTSDPRRLQWLSRGISDISNTGNTLVLVDRVECGQEITDFLEQQGKDVIFISGKMKVSDRSKEYDDVATADNKIIIATYGVAAVGINIPRIFNLIMLEPGKSFVRVIQSIGRGIRKAQDKDFVLIWDVCASSKYSKRHTAKRKQFYNEAQYPHKTFKVQVDKTELSTIIGKSNANTN